jgi:hypothetical protein
VKKALLAGIMFLAVSFALFAQGAYFDIGLGIGWAWTEIDGEDVAKWLEDSGANFDEVGVDLSLKIGYGPLGRAPIYIVGELGGVGHRIEDNTGFIQFNSYIIGGGLLVYPVSFIQLAGSIGFSSASNDSDIYIAYNSKKNGGFAYNASVAFDLGKGNHGCLIGLRYFNAANELKILDYKQSQIGLSIFVKYAYRHKLTPKPTAK